MLVWWSVFSGLATPTEAATLFLAIAATLGFVATAALQTLAEWRRTRRDALIFD